MSKSIKGKLLVFSLRLVALLPLAVMRALGVLVGWILWISHSEARMVTEKNLALCFPELSEARRKSLTKASLKETAKAAFETAAAWLWPQHRASRLIKSVHNEHLIKDGLASSRGLIVIMPHLGNWEMFNWYFPTVGQLTALYQPPPYPEMEALISRGRSAGGSAVVPTNLKGVGQLVKELKAGKMTGILPDQEPEVSGGVYAPVFGIPTLTMTLLSNLARKTNAVVIAGYVKRVPRGFEIRFSEVDEKIYDADDVVSVTAMNNAVENCVREAPEQYQWEYKRFKARYIRRSGFYKYSVQEMREFVLDDVDALAEESSKP